VVRRVQRLVGRDIEPEEEYVGFEPATEDGIREFRRVDLGVVDFALGQLPRDVCSRERGHAVARVVARFRGEHVGVRVAPQEFALYEQDDLRVVVAGAVLPEVVLVPRVYRLDVCHLVGVVGVDVGVGTPVPEPPEVGATAVCWIPPPPEFSGHLVVQPRHVGLDKLGVGLEHAHAVFLNLARTGQEVLLVQFRQQSVRELGERGVSHHLLDGVVALQQVWRAEHVRNVVVNPCRRVDAGKCRLAQSLHVWHLDLCWRRGPDAWRFCELPAGRLAQLPRPGVGTHRCCFGGPLYADCLGGHRLHLGAVVEVGTEHLGCLLESTERVVGVVEWPPNLARDFPRASAPCLALASGCAVCGPALGRFARPFLTRPSRLNCSVDGVVEVTLCAPERLEALVRRRAVEQRRQGVWFVGEQFRERPRQRPERVWADCPTPVTDCR